MSDTTKIGASHLSRAAYVYLRQSSPAQVEHNRESTQRQYALVSKAAQRGHRRRKSAAEVYQAVALRCVATRPFRVVGDNLHVAQRFRLRHCDVL